MIPQNRFLKYIKFNTASDEDSKTYPSTETQIKFAQYLKRECETIGLSDVHIDEHGYVLATLPANTAKKVPVIGFISHMDTSPEASGENVTPMLWENYDGTDIKLKGITLSPKEFPELLSYVGDTIITSDGTTLLGADDKAGIAEILSAMEYLIINSKFVKHGNIKIAFTPDEEIGKGVDFFNTEKFGADFAYTVDGGKVGELEYENFNAARAKIKIKGKSVHPGTAKGVMINASLVAMEMAQMLPKNETPETTSGCEGFFHLCSLNSTVSSASLNYIIRDFEKASFEKRKALIFEITEKINEKYGKIAEAEVYDEYLNMLEIMEKNMHVVELAKKSMQDIGLTPVIKPIRGGTDGARLSFMNLPCPNLFAGGHNFHGPYEYIPFSSMKKACELIAKIAENAALL